MVIHKNFYKDIDQPSSQAPHGTFPVVVTISAYTLGVARTISIPNQFGAIPIGSSPNQTFMYE